MSDEPEIPKKKFNPIVNLKGGNLSGPPPTESLMTRDSRVRFMIRKIRGLPGSKVAPAMKALEDILSMDGSTSGPPPPETAPARIERSCAIVRALPLDEQVEVFREFPEALSKARSRRAPNGPRAVD